MFSRDFLPERSASSVRFESPSIPLNTSEEPGGTGTLSITNAPFKADNRQNGETLTVAALQCLMAMFC